MLYLNQDDVRRLLDLDELLDALSRAFVELSAGRVSVPPRIAARSPGGLLASMPVHLPGVGLEVKLVTLFMSNELRGLPSHQALIALFDEDTGSALAVMDGTHITAARTAGAAALAVRTLARDDSRVLAILGAGVEGRYHLDAVTRVRSFSEVRVANRSPAAAARLAAEHEGARAVASFEEAVRGADVVCCCTHSAAPVLDFEWLAPGAHVSSVGSNQEGPELDAATVRRGTLVVESRVAFSPPPAGCIELQGMVPGTASELGEVLSGTRPGRASNSEVTVYKSMGHAVEDAAAAGLVYARALREGVGQQMVL